MDTRKLRNWLIGLGVIVFIYVVRYTDLLGFSLKGMDIGQQKIMLLIGYVVVLPGIIFLLRQDEEREG